MKKLLIGGVLKEYGHITEEQLQLALQRQSENPNERLGAILIDMKFVTEKQVLEALAHRLELKVVDLEAEKVNTAAVAVIPKQLAQKYGLIAINMRGNTLDLAVRDPLDFYALEDVRQVANMSLNVLLAEGTSIRKAIDLYYSEIEARRAVSEIHEAPKIVPVVIAAKFEHIEDDSAPVVKLLSSLLVYGYNTNASDIHVEIFENEMIIRMRIDGTIVDYTTLSTAFHAPLIARIKILSELDIAEKRIPQDGHFKAIIEGHEINVRISTIPTVYGEKAVIRFLYNNARIDRQGQFGMNDYNYKLLHGMIQNPNGIIYLTGPTGSGKTTTLYMVLEYLTRRQLNICTIEDPVERNIPRINQMQVNNKAGITFEIGLRALLRQDPDIIMVGETRDAETAQSSVRAAITGHLVFSTMHTNDALSAVVRLKDMGVPPYLIASSLCGVVAQRLVRKNCPHCKKSYTPTQEESEALGQDIQTVYKSAGCHLCNFTGYSGRIAIHEIASLDKTLRKMITEGADMDTMVDYAVQNRNMRTLKDSVLELVKSGVTSVEELIKISNYA